MKHIFTYGHNAYGLGDTLLLTAVFKYLPDNYVVQLPKRCQNFSILFEDICSVQISKYIFSIPDPQKNSKLHAATERLKFFFKEDAKTMDNRPLVRHFNKVMNNKAVEFLSKYKNPIIFSPFSSKNGADHRNLPDKVITRVMREYKTKGHDIIVTGMSDNFRKIQGADTHLVDSDLSFYTHLLRNCGRYVGCNTGDMHLAVGVGCLLEVYNPHDCERQPNFRANWCYNHPTVTNYFWKEQGDSVVIFNDKDQVLE